MNATPNRRRPPLALTVDPDVVARAREEAERRRMSLSRLVEVLLDGAAPKQGAA